MSSILVAGATSDAGKTVITTALCRVLHRRGITVAPFKAQNMSNNSMATAAGAEIGRAQWIQSVAAGAVPEPAMNPVLLKPSSDLRSQVVVMGRPAGTLEAQEYAGGRARLRDAAFAAYDDLAARFDVLVCEGAGGIAEINLRPWDYVNAGLAQHGSMPILIVGDIDRGGVFASLYGSLALLDRADQALVSGFLINRFRGDTGLLRPGLDDLRRLTGRPCHGVIPWADGLWLDSEDALALDARPHPDDGDPRMLRVAVVQLPRISNFTDIDALTLEPMVDVRFASTAEALRDADLVVLPGTRSTIADLHWLRRRGLDAAVAAHAGRGGTVLGICGGAQMLGDVIEDPDRVEAATATTAAGLRLLPLRTRFERRKRVELVSGYELGRPVHGYRIHHGRLQVTGAAEPFLDGCRRGPVLATMWHGALESDGFRRELLRQVGERAGRGGFRPDPHLVFEHERSARVDRLADLLERHADVSALVDLATTGPSQAYPFIPAGPR